VIRQTKHLLLDLINDEQLVRRLTMLKHMRYHIVAVHVTCQVEDAFEDFGEDRADLGLFTVLEHALDHSATELMD
jgi:3-keto-L-gulonate-6-phosphate decarboxylase